MVNLNTVEKIELESSCKLTPKILKRMPFAIYDHLSFYVNDKFIFCSGHKRPGVVRIGHNIGVGQLNSFIVVSLIVLMTVSGVTGRADI